MGLRSLQPPFSNGRRTGWRGLAAASLVAVALAGCQAGGPDVTGSIASGAAVSDEALRASSASLGDAFERNPGDVRTAIAYAAVLRRLDQKAQAVAVLQQATIRNPRELAVLAAYGKALADAGRLKEASDVLARAHTPERPDWRILSTQGAVADQMGDFAGAQGFYETALKIVPGEPTVLANQGLSYALAKKLPQAETILREAAAHPRADARVRQNLALVLGLQGRFDEAQALLDRDMPPAEAKANLAAIKRMVSQSNSWKALKQSGAAPARPGRDEG